MRRYKFKIQNIENTILTVRSSAMLYENFHNSEGTSFGIVVIKSFGIRSGIELASSLTPFLLSLPSHHAYTIVSDWCLNIEQNHRCRHYAQSRASAHHSATFRSSGYLRCVYHPFENMHTSWQIINIGHGCGSYAVQHQGSTTQIRSCFEIRTRMPYSMNRVSYIAIQLLSKMCWWRDFVTAAC